MLGHSLSLKALLNIFPPVADCPSHESTENEIELVAESPRDLHVHDLKPYVGRNTGSLISEISSEVRLDLQGWLHRTDIHPKHLIRQSAVIHVKKLGLSSLLIRDARHLVDRSVVSELMGSCLTEFYRPNTGPGTYIQNIVEGFLAGLECGQLISKGHFEQVVLKI